MNQLARRALQLGVTILVGMPEQPASPAASLKWTCPVCGHAPCLKGCRLGLKDEEVKRFRGMFDGDAT